MIMAALFDPDARPIIAHRGASAFAPENTIEAFALAVEHGADAFEFDIRVTADGIPVVVHDATLQRTTGDAGVIAGLTLAEVQRADAGARFSLDGGRSFPWRHAGVRIPTLEEVLSRFPDVPCIIEIKDPAAADPARAVLRRLGAGDRCVLMSFDPRALDTARAHAELTGATGSETAALIRAELQRRVLERVPYRVLSVPERRYGMPLPLRLLTRGARRLGCPVHVWVVDSVRRATRLWRKGVAGIVTNNPRELRAARDRFNHEHP
jgi:glycerophosphoryl diester phosphodiesterase